MRNLKLGISFLLLLAATGSVIAEYIPAGYEYLAPTGTVSLFQDYGSGAGKDGVGTWSGDAAVTLNDDSMTFNVKSWTYQKTLLPFDVGDNANVVDICIKGWNSLAASSSDAITLNESAGTWGAKYAFPMRTDGTINPISGKGTGTADVPLNTGTIIRLVRTGYRGDMYVVAGDDSLSYITATSPSGWGASDSSIVINSGLSSNNYIEIAWMKVYSGVDASALTAPLAAVPEPATLALACMGGIAFVIRRKK